MVENIFDMSRQNSAEISALIRRASASSQATETEGMEIDYDAEMDYLRISVGEPREALAFDLEDQAESVLLYDPQTFAIVGLEVPSFMKSIEAGKLRGEFWELTVRLVEDHGPTLYIPGRQDAERAGRAFRDLVPA